MLNDLQKEFARNPPPLREKYRRERAVYGMAAAELSRQGRTENRTRTEVMERVISGAWQICDAQVENPSPPTQGTAHLLLFYRWTSPIPSQTRHSPPRPFLQVPLIAKYERGRSEAEASRAVVLKELANCEATIGSPSISPTHSQPHPSPAPPTPSPTHSQPNPLPAPPNTSHHPLPAPPKPSSPLFLQNQKVKFCVSAFHHPALDRELGREQTKMIYWVGLIGGWAWVGLGLSGGWAWVGLGLGGGWD